MEARLALPPDRSTAPSPAGADARVPGVRLVWRRQMPASAPASGIPLFVGFVDAAADLPAVPLRRWEHWRHSVGVPAAGFLEHAVRGFFENGGALCWVVGLAAPVDADAAALGDRLRAAFRSEGTLEDLAEPDLVCVPDAVWGPLGTEAGQVLAVQEAVLAYCHRMNDRFAILDCLPALPGVGGGLSERVRHRLPSLATTSPATANGALYWPWIQVVRGDRSGVLREVPPCGHVAGVYARLDADAGRHRAPANVRLEGAVDLDAATRGRVDRGLLAELNEDGINSLRSMAGRGVVVGGARTLSSRADWRYVQVRRVVLGLVRWAESSLRDLVLEGQRPALWELVRQRVLGHCLALWRSGALQGDTPEQAFEVKCDAETNPPASRDAGRLVCELRLAISTPAEFVSVQLIQSAESVALLA